MAVTRPVAPGEAAHALLGELVATAKSDDPMAPVTVAVPSNYAGLAARRRLAWDAGGLVNVRFLVLDRVADLVGGPVLAATGRRPLTRPIRAEAVRAELRAAPGSFGHVAGHPATERSLERAFLELRACEPAVLERLAAQGSRAADIVRLFRSWRARVARGWYDEHDLAEAAAAAIRGGAAHDDVGRLIVFLPRRLAPAQQRMLDAFGDRATIVLGDLDAVTDDTTHAVSTPDADDEVRAAIRLVAERLEAGVPLHRMAVFYGTGDPYARLLARQLGAAHIPWNGPAVRTLAETVTGRALLGLLALPDRAWPRGEVIGWMAGAPILSDGRPVPSARWDLLSREAGITHGPDQWDGHLADLSTRKAEAADGADPDDPEWLAPRLRDDVEQLDALRVFVAELVAATVPPMAADGHATWAALAGWAEWLLERYLGDEGRHGAWPEDERTAANAVRDALQGLADLDVIGEPTDLATFRRAVDRELDAPAPRGVGRYGDGLLVAPLHLAAGLDVDVVLVVGMAEGTVPARNRVDALLPERERSAAGGVLADISRTVEDAHDMLRHAIATARRERILLCPRADLRRGRAHLPSRWLPAAVGVVPSFEAGLAASAPAALHEHDLRALLAWRRAGGSVRSHPLVRSDPTLSAGLSAEHARRSAAFTAFDGRVPPGAVPVPGGDEPVSPTSLETYAACPRRYLMGRVLRVAAVEKPEQIMRISALDRGVLVHAILERFIQGALAGEPRTLERLLGLADELGARYEQAGLTGKRLLWVFDLRRVQRELSRLHEQDHLEPLAAEMRFGVRDDPPVMLHIGERRVGFRGMVDRVDRAPDGGIVVTDYKTGSPTPYATLADDPVARGTKLQLAVYGLAARPRFGAGEIRSRYWFISDRAGFAEIGYPVDAHVVGRLADVVGRALDGIGAGLFPARPGEPDQRGRWENCLFCDYDRLCPRDRARQWERKRTAPELSGYVELAEGPQ